MNEDETSLIHTIGRYQAITELGRGAMGVVYKGYDPAIGRTVALKTIAFGAADAQAKELRRRLYVEASAAGGLTHPNIVTVYDVIEDGTTTAVAMEFVEGQTLAAILAEAGALPLDRALALFEQICAALDYAGAKGIVHRDIKPANILVGTDGRPKIADFGIARLPTSNATQTGMVLGSPSYMSPEQVRGQPLDRRSDLFSAATLFYEMVTLENPFGGVDAATTMYRIAHEPPTLSSQVNELLGPNLAAVINRALSKDPAQRFETGTDLVTALKDAAMGRASGAMPATAAAAGAAPAPPAWQRFGLAAGVGGLIVAGAAGYLLMRGGASPSSATPASTPPASVASAAGSTTAPPAKATAPVPPATAAPAAAAVPAAAVPAAAAPPAAAVPPVKAAPAWLDVRFEGAPFPVALFAGNQQVGQVDKDGAVSLTAGQRRLRAVSESVFLTKDLGAAAPRPGERAKVFLPGLASAVIGVKGDVYGGVKVFLDDRPLPGPYPAQIPQIAAGKHAVRITWELGPQAGKELTGSLEAKSGGHFLIRADPDNEKIAIQQVR